MLSSTHQVEAQLKTGLVSTLCTVALCGCIENWLHGDPGEPDDGKPPLEDSGHPPQDTQVVDTQPPACDEIWQDGTADLVESCPAAAEDLGELITAWRASNGDVPYWDLLSLRRQDTDGDGSIGPGDAMQLLLLTQSGLLDSDHCLGLVDQDGTLLGLMLEDAWRAAATAFEQDASTPGEEIFTSTYALYDTLSTLVRFDALLPAWSVSFGAHAGHAWYPWAADLEGDGSAELFIGQQVFHANDGSVAFELEDVRDEGVVEVVTSDLDLDGTQEIVVASVQGVRIHEPNGSLRASCMSGPPGAAIYTLAIGDLDGDEQGEIVAAGDGLVAVCDTDGSLLRQVAHDSAEPTMVGVAQLDHDSAAEVVVADYQGIVALDNDLSILWSYRERPSETNWLWHPFTLADLNRDGLHEILVSVSTSLVILGPDGAELARHPTVSNASWRAAPLVADIDADGLAEIVVTGLEGVELIENDAGGWQVPGAVCPHHSYHHYPGDRGTTGTLPAPDHHPWRTAATNVWQGEELVTAFPGHTELSVDIIDVCVIDCDGDAVVTAYVSNHGVQDIEQEVSVELFAAASGTLLATELLPGLTSQQARVVQIAVRSTQLNGGLLLTADMSDLSAECGTRSNEDTWDEDPCP
jgi:hypothetical protein